MGKHNQHRPQIQLKSQGPRSPAPSAEIMPSQPQIEEEDTGELDEHEEGALETDATEAAPEVEALEEVASPDAELVTEAPAPRATVIAPRRAVQGKTAEVTPMLTVNRIRIGPTWYHFERGKRVSVPREIIPFLVERTILAPGTR